MYSDLQVTTVLLKQRKPKQQQALQKIRWTTLRQLIKNHQNNMCNENAQTQELVCLNFECRWTLKLHNLTKVGFGFCVLDPVKVKINHPPRHLENLFDFQSRVCLECTLRRRFRGCSSHRSIQRAGVCNHKDFQFYQWVTVCEPHKSSCFLCNIKQIYRSLCK